MSKHRTLAGPTGQKRQTLPVRRTAAICGKDTIVFFFVQTSRVSCWGNIRGFDFSLLSSCCLEPDSEGEAFTPEDASCCWLGWQELKGDFDSASFRAHL